MLNEWTNMVQIIWIALVAIELLLSANQHGKIELKKTNFWEKLIELSLITTLLYIGGFFK